MPYYPNIADSFTRGLQAGTELGGSIVDGINRRKMMERQDEQDARADAILQIQNPGLKIGRKIKGVDGRPDALSAEAVLPGQENDIVKPLGGGATYNVSERDRVDSAIAEREEKQALRRMEAQILLEKKYKDKKRTYDSTSGKQIFENADGSLSYDDVYRAGAGDPLKGQFDRESDRRATESDADFKRRVLLEEADRTFKSGEADKDRTFQKSLSDIKRERTPVKMSQADEKLVETLSSANAKKISIANQIEQGFNTLSDKNTDEKTKVAIGRQLLKTLNSTEGADAVGSEESKRLGSLLEYNFFDPKAAISGQGALIGRDLKGFTEQVGESMRNVRGAVAANEKIISGIESKYGVGGQSEASGSEKLNRDQAADILKQAGGDKAKARDLARKLGYSF